MKLEFINHASVLISYEEVNLIMDPWFEGKIFDNGWDLLAESQFKIEDFNQITHIWFSHEHPDHFNPPIISKIPDEVKKNITILYHQTKDKKIINFCENKGFKEVVELSITKEYTIYKDLKIKSNHYTEGDSWAYLWTDNFRILNLNDCIVCTKKDAQLIKEQIGEVDLLLTQFGYANKIGNENDISERLEAIDEKLVRIKNQETVFKPKFILPFASFVFFCHEENKYMNPPHSIIRNVHDFIERDLNTNSIVMYPGDSWDLSSKVDSSDAIAKYEKDFAKIANYDFVNTASVSKESLIEKSVLYGKKLVEKNPTAKELINKIGTIFYVSDYGQSYLFRGDRGLEKTQLSKEDCDLIISSEALEYIFKFEWGAGTCNVNARYFTTEKGDSYKFNLLMRMSNLNNQGEEYFWSKPSFLERLKHRLKTFINV